MRVRTGTGVNRTHTTFGILARALLVGGALACAQQARAAITEADFLEDMPVVLSASRLSQPVSEAPAAVTVIDQDMIRASGFRDIPDLFRLVPGFTVAYTRDNTWGVSYHGLGDAFSRRMQVLIDGRSVYTPAFGEVPWASLPISIEDIERIEVVRGPNSAAYGSNAFLGVINIITKTAAQVAGSHLSVQAGTRGNSGALFRYGNGTDDLQYRLTVSDQRRDRFATQAELTTTRHMDLRVDYRLSATDELNTTFALSRGDWRQGVAGDMTDPVRGLDVGSEHFQTRFHRVIDAENEWSLQFYHIRQRKADEYLVPLGGGVPVNLGYMQWRDDLEFQRISRLSDSLRIVWGSEARREGVTAPGYFYNEGTQSGTLFRLFGNAEWRLAPQWTVNAGALAENHYLSGFDLSPRLAVNFLPAPDHALRASISRAYRSPTFFEESGDQRYYTLTGTLIRRIFAPSAGLQAEQIVSRELGYVGHVRPLQLQVDVRLFRDSLTRLISDQNIGTPTSKLFQYANLLEATIRGGDTQLRWTPRRWFDLVLSYAWVKIDSPDVDYASSTPRNNFSALGVFRLDRGWEASVGVYRQDYMIWLNDGDYTAPFTRVDARVAKRWQVRDTQVELALVGQNLGGRNYQEFRDDNLFGRRTYLSLTLDW